MLVIKKVLVPIDLSGRSGPAVEHGVNIAEHFKAEVIFLHVVPPITSDAAQASGYPDGITPTEDTEKKLDEILAAFLEKTAPGATGERIVVRGDPATVITHVAKKRDVQLMVMPTTGGGAFRRYVMGSVTARVLDASACTILTGLHVESISAFEPRPYHRVGCAVDLRGSSSDALQQAQGFASVYGANVIAIHAVSPHESSMESGTIEGARALLKRLLKEAGIDSEPVVEIGSPEEILLKTAREQALDLLVAERRGPGGVEFDVIRKSPCPVLSVCCGE